MRKQIQEKCVGGSSRCNSVRKRSPATQRGRRLPIGRLDCGWSEQRSDWSVGGNKGAATATTTPQGNKVWDCQSLHWGHRTSSSSSSLSYSVTISITPIIINLFIFITDNIMLPISHFYVLFVAELKTTLKISLLSPLMIGSKLTFFDLFLTLGLGTSRARNENLRPLLNTNIPLIVIV